MINSNVTQEMKINKSCFNIFPELESERVIYGVVLAKRGFYTLRQLLPKNLLSKHSELELIHNSSNSKKYITSV